MGGNPIFSRLLYTILSTARADLLQKQKGVAETSVVPSRASAPLRPGGAGSRSPSRTSSSLGNRVGLATRSASLLEDREVGRGSNVIRRERISGG